MRTASTAVMKLRSQIAAPVLVFHTRSLRGENAGCSIIYNNSTGIHTQHISSSYTMHVILKYNE